MTCGTVTQCATVHGVCVPPAAVLDVAASKWVAAEPTPFSRCAHCAGAAPRALADPGQQHGTGSAQDAAPRDDVLVYGGFSGESVEGDVLRIDSRVGALLLYVPACAALCMPGCFRAPVIDCCHARYVRGSA